MAGVRGGCGVKGFLQSLAATPAFSNAFWVFVGIVSGALIQHFLGYLQSRRQAKNAFKVMQIEIEYNLSEVDRFLEHLNWLKSRIQAGQIAEDELFLPMQKFDYSSIAPLANSGYFHILLGPENVRKYLEFNHFFRIPPSQIKSNSCFFRIQ